MRPAFLALTGLAIGAIIGGLIAGAQKGFTLRKTLAVIVASWWWAAETAVVKIRSLWHR